MLLKSLYKFYDSYEYTCIYKNNIRRECIITNEFEC